MCIYLITNHINHKQYVGKTTGTMKRRFQRHIQDAISNRVDTHLARSIRKYGADNFSVELIEEVEDESILGEREKYWIKYYDTYYNGFNETEGGDGGNTYASKSEEEMDEIKEKIRQAKIGDKNPNSKSVKCLNVETGEEIKFPTVAACKDYFGEKNHRFITNRTNHTTRGLYKKVWAIAYLDDEYEYEKNVRKHGKSIEVYSDGELIGTYASISNMCDELEIPRSRITELIKNNGNEFYYDDYDFVVLN